MVKNPLAKAGDRVRFLGEEDPLEMERQPILGFLSGKSQRQRCLASYSPSDSKESDSTD